MGKQVYLVLVDDNFHYMDEDERYSSGRFDSYEEAVEHCKYLVDRYLTQAYREGMTAEALYDSYRSFGEDPFIRMESPGPDTVEPFSAWAYAKRRCDEFTRAGH